MKLHNTLSRKVEDFKPIEDKKVKLYTCGLTVYSHPHIGNWVAYIYWDVLVRVLKANGYSVEHVQNITDVGHLTSDEDAGEDKMLKSALKEGTTAWQVAEKYMKVAEHEGYDLLELQRPGQLVRATDYIAQQIAFVQALDKKGYTYVIKDGVYFDTSKLSDYGALARLDIDGLQFGARVADTGKKNPTDFAVWKLSDPNEKRDMEWDSPWGKGFPGWHLECSTIIHELLGDQIDIHTGGIDHIPVHHTNEIAQTEALTGKKLANFWVHNNHLKVNGTKISKSLGNGYTLDDVIEKGFSPAAFKLMVLSKHYRTEGNFTWEILEAAQNRLNRWQAVADTRWQGQSEGVSFDFLDILSHDINTPAVLTEIDLHFNEYAEQHLTPPMQVLEAINDLLGVNLLKEDINQAQKQLINDRADARADKDWDKADDVRQDLKDQGLEVIDTPNGQIWSRL